jgi:uncharacterized membrane protein
LGTKAHTSPVCSAWITGAIFTCAYAVVTVRRFAQFDVASWDNAIFQQEIAAYAHLKAPIVTIKGAGYNILGDHFSPINALVAPFYRLFPYAETLLVAQALLVGFSIVVVTRLAVRQINSRVGVLIGVLYATSFGVQFAMQVQFHEVAFAAPLLALAGEAYVEKRYKSVFWWSLPLLIVKEDLGVTVAAIGAVLWLAGERRRGLVLAIIGIVGWVLTVWVIIPHFNTSGGYDYSSTFAGNDGVLSTLFAGSRTKLITLTFTVFATGIVAVRSPWALAVVPTFAWRFLGDKFQYWTFGSQYSLVVMAILFVALVDVLKDRPKLRSPSLGIAVVVACGTCLVISPVQFFTPPLWTDTPRMAAAQGAVAAVPKDVAVLTDTALVGHLAGHVQRLYVSKTIGPVEPDCFAVDTQLTYGDLVLWAAHSYGGTWASTYKSGGFEVACRTSS